MAVEVGRRGGEEGEGGGGGAEGEGAGGGAEGVPARGGTGLRRERERERDTHQSPKFRRRLRTDRLTLFH